MRSAGLGYRERTDERVTRATVTDRGPGTRGWHHRPADPQAPAGHVLPELALRTPWASRDRGTRTSAHCGCCGGGSTDRSGRDTIKDGRAPEVIMDRAERIGLVVAGLAVAVSGLGLSACGGAGGGGGGGGTITVEYAYVANQSSNTVSQYRIGAGGLLAVHPRSPRGAPPDRAQGPGKRSHLRP
jgi:hypothetical protein